MANYIKVNGELIPLTSVESVTPLAGGVNIRLLSGRHMAIPARDAMATTEELLSALGWTNLVLELNNNT